MQRLRYGGPEDCEVVSIAEGITLELPGEVEANGVEIDGSLFTVRLRLEMTEQGIRPTVVTVESEDDPPSSVTGTTLRAVKVWELAVEGIRLGLSREGGKATMLSAERAEQLRALGPKPETLEWVAFFYNLGAATGLPPARQVELGLGVPRTTASKWVRRAREAGLIDG